MKLLALKVFFTVTIYFCISRIDCHRTKRNVVEFGEMIGMVTGRDPIDFYGYGNYCGYGGGGPVLDPIDLCCKEHDECYADQKVSHCSIFLPKYTWTLTATEGIKCLDYMDNYCDRHLCECDKIVSQCFAENDIYYTPNRMRRVHSLAEKLFHFIEPMFSFIA